MDQLQKTINRIMTTQKSITNQSPDAMTTSPKTYECELCKDTEFIHNPETNAFSFCSCREAKRCKKLLELSGISGAFRKKTVNGYKPKNEQQSLARNMAVEYIKSFEHIRNSRNNSTAFLGQVGAGKSHLTIAIANALLKQGIGVRYMQYREIITYLKQLITDEFMYQSEIDKYKRCNVLLIDDIYKGATNQGRVNESEMRIMFEIINHRYLAELPILVSGEHDIETMISLDEATGSRIAEMCQGRVIVFKGKELNHRMG
jgi:DNA replication protein DnaC